MDLGLKLVSTNKFVKKPRMLKIICQKNLMYIAKLHKKAYVNGIKFKNYILNQLNGIYIIVKTKALKQIF